MKDLNPFKAAKFIRVGHTPEAGFTLELDGPGLSLKIKTGKSAVVVAGLLRENGVRHYDLTSALTNDGTAYQEFSYWAKLEGVA